MRNYSILLRVFLKNTLLNLNNPGSKKIKAAGYWLIILFGCGAVAYYLYVLSDMIFGAGLPETLMTGFLGMLLMATQLMGMFLSIRTMHGMFSNERDLPFLLSLPVSNRAIFASKYTGVYLSELPFNFVMIAPIIVGFARHYGQGVSTYVMAFIFILLSPALPLALGSLLSMLIGRLLKGARINDTLKSLLGILFMAALLIGIYAGMGRFNPETMDKGQVQNILLSMVQVTSMLRGGFPPTDWAAQAITSPNPNGVLMLGFLAPCLVLTVILILIGGNYYAKHALSEGGSYTKSVKGPLHVRRHSPLIALMRREWRGLIRSPLYAMNSLMSIVMSPIIMILPLLMPTMNVVAEFGASNEAFQPIIVYIGMGIMGFAGIINPGLDTTISREGKTLYFLKIIPVSPARQMTARILVALIIGAVGCLLAAIVMPLAWPIGYPYAFLAALTTLLAMIPAIILSTLPDMFRPKLNWQNEQQAIKQNFNSVIGMIICAVALAPHVVIFIALSSYWEASLFVSMGASLLMTLILIPLYPKWANKAFRNLS